MKQYVQVSVNVSNEEVSNLLVALLADAGYEGFQEEAGELKAFIAEDAFDEKLLKEVLLPHGLAFTTDILPVTNWNQQWEQSFEPVVVDNFCGIRAGFHAPLASVRHEIVITPKMSFGTGHHATTFMMLELMRMVDFRGKYVFDFGTGTGVLAILAEKLGADKVLAMDNDEWSMHNAAENLLSNHTKGIHLLHSGNIPQNESFDIIIANINKQVIVDTLTQMKQQLRPGGTILLSGLLEKDLEDVNTIAEKAGLTFEQQLSRSGWVALQYCILPYFCFPTLTELDK
jgi:ribosomal protein L11 methyltransferase